jgi:hypothetical protein
MSVWSFLRLFAFLNIEIKNFLLSFFFFFLVENNGKRRRAVAAGEGAEMAHSRGSRYQVANSLFSSSAAQTQKTLRTHENSQSKRRVKETYFSFDLLQSSS